MKPTKEQTRQAVLAAVKESSLGFSNAGKAGQRRVDEIGRALYPEFEWDLAGGAVGPLLTELKDGGCLTHRDSLWFFVKDIPGLKLRVPESLKQLLDLIRLDRTQPLTDAEIQTIDFYLELRARAVKAYPGSSKADVLKLSHPEFFTCTLSEHYPTRLNIFHFVDEALLEKQGFTPADVILATIELNALYSYVNIDGHPENCSLVPIGPSNDCMFEIRITGKVEEEFFQKYNNKRFKATDLGPSLNKLRAYSCTVRNILARFTPRLGGLAIMKAKAAAEVNSQL